MSKIGKTVSELQQRNKNRDLAGTEDLFTADLICELVSKASGKPITDMFEAGDVIYDILFQGFEARKKLFNTFLDVSTDVSYDWFSKPFAIEMADRTKKAQYFTPAPMAQLSSTLVTFDEPDGSFSRQDPTAGTGSMTCAQYEIDRKKHSPFDYKPSMYWYEATELKEEGKKSRALPFLLFNFLIRGMDGVVIAGNSLTREISQIFFIQDLEDTQGGLGFSHLNVMPRTPDIEAEFDVRSWIDTPLDYMEDTWERTKEVAERTEKKERKQAEHEKDMLDGMLNVVKKQNEANPNAGKIKDMPKDDRDNLGDQLDGILKIFGVTPDPQIRKQYFG